MDSHGWEGGFPTSNWFHFVLPGSWSCWGSWWDIWKRLAIVVSVRCWPFHWGSASYKQDPCYCKSSLVFLREATEDSCLSLKQYHCLVSNWEWNYQIKGFEAPFMIYCGCILTGNGMDAENNAYQTGSWVTPDMVRFQICSRSSLLA